MIYLYFTLAFTLVFLAGVRVGRKTIPPFTDMDALFYIDKRKREHALQPLTDRHTWT